jgi:hypothetical protein
VPLDAFIHQRVRYRGLTIYRRECRFGFRQVSASPEELENLSAVESQTVPTIDEQQFERDEAKLVKEQERRSEELLDRPFLRRRNLQ